MYEHFLLSDKAIRERKHHDWFTRGLPPATDTWYDNYKWVDLVQNGGKSNKIVGDPLVKYRDHVAFLALNQGCSLYCRGKIVLRVFFVDDKESHWDEEGRERFRGIVSTAAGKIIADAQSDGVSIEIFSSYADKSVSCAVMPNGKVRTWLDEIFNTAKIVDDQNNFRMVIGCDESPIIFVFNKDLRGCAYTAEDLKNAGRNHPEWSIVSYQKNFSDRYMVHVLVHELLHQFGATDLYYPTEITVAGEKFLGESIMNCGMEVDDLTRFLIGWRAKLTDKVISFLDATKSVTKQQVMEARRKEMDRRKGQVNKWLDRLVFVMAMVMSAQMAEARPRGWNPNMGRAAFNRVQQQISNAQRDAERRAKQEEANRQRREKEWQRQQQAEQRRLQKEADNRARQLEIQRKKAEADAAKAEAQRLEMQRLQRLSEEQRMQRQLMEDRQRQYDIEQQKLALDRQRWKEEADHDGWSFFGILIPSWLWKGIVTSLGAAALGWLISLLFKK